MTKSLRPGKIFLDWSQTSPPRRRSAPTPRGRELPCVASDRDEVEQGAEAGVAAQLMYDEVLERA